MDSPSSRSLCPELSAERLNRECYCITLDRDALCEALEREVGDADFCAKFIRTRPHLFSNVPVFVSEGHVAEMLRIVRAIEAVTRLPAYRDAVLSWAPEVARHDHVPLGVFMGYDFHLAGDRPRLIENHDKPLDGRIEMDDAYLGGERSGGKRGRGSPGKTPFVAAVETTEDGKAHRVKLRRVRRFTKKNIKKITGRIVKRGARVVTDGLGCFNGVADAGCTHEAIVTGSGRKAARHPAFKAVNTVLGNIKSAIAATFRSGSRKHAPRRLAEFEYRFNRRYDLPAMMPRLGWVAVRTPPMPYRLLKLAEDYG